MNRATRAMQNIGGSNRTFATALLTVLVFGIVSVELDAHGVSGKDAVFLMGLQGRAIGPLLYLGAKHMVTGYDHLAFLVGVIFFPPGEDTNLLHYQHEIDATLRRHGLAPLGWRHVPVDESALGAHAREARRDVWQVLIGDGMVSEEDLPLTLFRVKAEIERSFRDIYVVSLSPRSRRLSSCSLPRLRSQPIQQPCA